MHVPIIFTLLINNTFIGIQSLNNVKFPKFMAIFNQNNLTMIWSAQEYYRHKEWEYSFES